MVLVDELGGPNTAVELSFVPRFETVQSFVTVRETLHQHRRFYESDQKRIFFLRNKPFLEFENEGTSHSFPPSSTKIL